MHVPANDVLLVLFLVLLAKLVHAIVAERRLKRLMPPGPPGLPLIGNALQLTQVPWFRLTEWKQQYGRYIQFSGAHTRQLLTPVSPGPIYSITAFGQPVVVVNDFKSAADLLGSLTPAEDIRRWLTA